MTDTHPAADRLLLWCGAVGPILTISAIFICVARSPWFNWHAHALSDMGVHPDVAPLFNGALMAGGLLILAFAWGLARWLGSDVLIRLACFLLGLGGLALVLVGVFPADRGLLHNVPAIGYFVLSPLAMILFGIAFAKAGETAAGVLSILAALAASIFVFLTPHQGVAVPEILGVIVLSSWNIAMAVTLLSR